MKKPLLFTILVIISIGFVFAVPMIPTVFNGAITYTGDVSMNLNGYDINVTIPGQPEWKVGVVGQGNSYEVDVSPDSNSNLNGDISFYIGGVEANEVGTYIKGGFVFLDLTIDSIPTQDIEPQEYCGDGICNNGETCSSCSQDCGSCDNGDDDDNDNHGGGGGSSGSSGGSKTIILDSNDEDDNTDSINTGSTPITGGVVKKDGFSDFLNSGGAIILLAGLIIVLGIILILVPSGKRK